MKIIMIPKNHEYIRRLKSCLEEIGVRVQILKPFHYSTVMNIIKMIAFRTQGYKIIHVHWLYIFPFSLVMKLFYYLCKILVIKIIWEMHNILPHNCSETDRKISLWFYEKSDAIIFHSKTDIQRSKEILGTAIDKMYVIVQHGNFNGSYENNISQKNARRILDIPDNKKVILCFGFIRKNRGYEYLLEAAKDMKDTIVIIAGKKDDKDVYLNLLNYEKQMSNLKLFIKWIPDREVQLYFNACDIVVLPYTDITTSGVIPLSYAFSKPVVTTNLGGLTDVVNENTGILVPPKDTAALRKAIERIFIMDLEAMGRYAHEYAKKEFSWELNAQKIKELYGQLTLMG